MSKVVFKPKQASADAQQTTVLADEKKGLSVLQKIGTVWSFISAGYAVASTCAFIAKGWVDAAYSYALIPLLVVFIAVFIALVVLSVKTPQNAKNNAKTYKKAIGIFKAFSNVFFIVISAVSMAGIVTGDVDITKWIVFFTTLIIALVQLAFKVASLVRKIAKRRMSQRFNVQITSYKDGVKKRKSISDSVREKGYDNK